MRDYILGNKVPKRKTMGEYIIEAKLEALKRQLETFTPSVCECCGLVGHGSQDCQVGNSCDDYEIFPIEDQHDPHPPKSNINYIPPCLRRLPPIPTEEPDINEALTNFNQNTIFDFSQRPKDSTSTRVEPNVEKEAENITLASAVDLTKELGHEGLVPIECEHALTEESNCEEKGLVVLDKKERSGTSIIFGQTILNIGDVVIEVHNGKNLSCDLVKAKIDLHHVKNVGAFVGISFGL
ncbi:hypothetical protein TSUD_187670 [Trifolium subterraneum]|uniref:Uncharacterized protein n=1 Tax=Trifolium subterraneum TaxID=3900 RepID=A0A2Z6PHY4_TRISU|nr:hypothetical protein TSUD_187670 [Trifolium subterraneum]